MKGESKIKASNDYLIKANNEYLISINLIEDKTILSVEVTHQQQLTLLAGRFSFDALPNPLKHFQTLQQVLLFLQKLHPQDFTVNHLGISFQIKINTFQKNIHLNLEKVEMSTEFKLIKENSLLKAEIFKLNLSQDHSLQLISKLESKIQQLQKQLKEKPNIVVSSKELNLKAKLNHQNSKEKADYPKEKEKAGNSKEKADNSKEKTNNFKEKPKNEYSQKGKILIVMKDIFGQERSSEYYKFIDANFQLGQEALIQLWIEKY